MTIERPITHGYAELDFSSPENRRKIWLKIENEAELDFYLSKARTTLAEFAAKTVGLTLNDLPVAILERAVLERLEALRDSK